MGAAEGTACPYNIHGDPGALQKGVENLGSVKAAVLSLCCVLRHPEQ